MDDGGRRVRIDQWLWAARFFKTRSLANQAVGGGKVHVNGQRVKPAREVRIGDTLRILRGTEEFVVIVLGVNTLRRPASEAQALYLETPESLASRETKREERRYAVLAQLLGPPKRPGKRDRRRIREFTRMDGEE